jgi:hypothetical protein
LSGDFLTTDPVQKTYRINTKEIAKDKITPIARPDIKLDKIVIINPPSISYYQQADGLQT